MHNNNKIIVPHVSHYCSFEREDKKGVRPEMRQSQRNEREKIIFVHEIFFDSIHCVKN